MASILPPSNTMQGMDLTASNQSCRNLKLASVVSSLTRVLDAAVLALKMPQTRASSVKMRTSAEGITLLLKRTPLALDISQTYPKVILTAIASPKLQPSHRIS